MIVEHLTYAQAAERLDAAHEAVELLEDELRRARRTLRRAEAEMYHALFIHQNLPESLRGGE